MVIIVKKLVPVYDPDAAVPKRYLNLRKAVHVTSFKHLYPNISRILTGQYDLKLTEKVVVFWTKEISTPRFRRYRMNFRKVYSGPLSGLDKHLEQMREQKSPSGTGSDS